MAKHKSKKKMNLDIPQLTMTLLKANLIGYALTAIFIIFASILLTYTNLGAGFEKWIVLIGAMASAALVGYDTAKMEGKQGYKWGLIGGLSYLLIFVIIAVVLNGIACMDISTLMTLVIITLISGALAGMFSVATQK
ncbi:MAG: TIGR04086 family membrane protein [Cellulosilyticaceae bacterium]